MKRLIVVGVMLGAGVAIAQPAPKFPAPEQGATGATLPPVPAFQVVAPAGGAHGVRELHVDKKAHFGTELKVTGYITWIYDCVTDVRKPGQSVAAAQKMIDEDPTLCQRKKLYLGDAKTTAKEQGLWVVEVPRAPNKLEKLRLPKDELKAWPAVPALKVGDYVTITGTFDLRSNRGEANSDGLLIWKSFAKAKPPKTPALVEAAAPARTTKPLEVVPVKVAAAAKAQADVAAAKLADGMKQLGSKQYATAVEAFRAAVKADDGNARAWYGLGLAYAMRLDWAEAQAAWKRALERAPAEGMFAMSYGVATYELVLRQARDDAAKRQGKKPDEVTVDLTTIDFAKAEGALLLAQKSDPTLWRASYYLGRIARDAGRTKEAAELFTQACVRSPGEAGPWVALVELYRTWELPDAAIAVAEQGLNYAATDGDVPYVLGLALDDKGQTDKAISAYTLALDRNKGHSRARFQRGQALVKKGRNAEAKVDLEAYLVAPVDPFSAQQANKLLMELAAKQR